MPCNSLSCSVINPVSRVIAPEAPDAPRAPRRARIPCEALAQRLAVRRALRSASEIESTCPAAPPGIMPGSSSWPNESWSPATRQLPSVPASPGAPPGAGPEAPSATKTPGVPEDVEPFPPPPSVEAGPPDPPEFRAPSAATISWRSFSGSSKILFVASESRPSVRAASWAATVVLATAESAGTKQTSFT